MKHFDHIEWLLYKTNNLSISKQIEIEEHLYNCDECLAVFLSSIEEKEIGKASELIPENFTQNLVEEISKNKVKSIERKRSKNKTIHFGYYVAVASITIFLTMGGIFTNLVDVVPKVSMELELHSNMDKPNFVYSFSEKIVNKTSKLIGSIENIEEREIRRNKNER